MTRVTLLLSQLRYVNKAFWRNPASAFFTFMFPLMLLVIFTSLLGNFELPLPGRIVSASTYYVAAMAGFAVISACYNNIAMNITGQRDLGVLKRTHGSPLPNSIYLAARVVHATLIAVLLVAITAAFGRIAYHADIPTGVSLLQFVAMLLVGAGGFAALGLAITSVIPNADAAPAIVNASILPVLFVSGIFIPLDNKSPEWIQWTARIFPVREFVSGLEAGLLGTRFSWGDVALVALWGLGGLLLAVLFFSWEPRT
jgi:ABC-2 type transport system permease protein